MRVPFTGERNAEQLLSDKALLIRTALIAGFILVWDLVGRVGIVDPLFLAPPGRVVSAIFELLGEQTAIDAFARTGSSILTAFVIGTSAGIFVACLIGASEAMRRAFLTPLTFLLSTPKSIFLPVFILIFGLGTTSAAAFGAFEAFFYVVINVVGGLGLVEDRHLRVARAYKAGVFHRYVDVIGPAALPGLFAALWFGIKHAFLGVMIAQLWASDGGIGPLIRMYSSALKTDYVLAIVLIVTLVAVAAGSAWTKLETRLSRWRGAGTGSVVQSVPA